jgi:hypothetical protein
MKKILTFITHRTLTYDHADMCIRCLSLSVNPIIFDIMYIYNTHQHEVLNSQIIELCDQYKVSRFIKAIYEYPNIQKSASLGEDLINIFKFYTINFDKNDHIF